MKKTISFIFVIIFIFYLAINSYAFEFSQSLPADIDEHWSEDAISLLNKLCIMNGFNGYIYPDSLITRGEFTALIVRSFDFKKMPAENKFTDVSSSSIFYDDIMIASSNSIIGGYSDNTFREKANITREEIMLIISRLSDKGYTKKAVFKDIGSNYKYIDELSKICEDGIISGYPDGTFKPQNNTTRAESASLIVSAMKKYLPSLPVQDVYNDAFSYIQNHFSDISKADEVSTGEAKKDIEYIKNTYKTAYDLGYNIVNSVSDINFISYNQYGPITEFSVEYKVTRNSNGVLKTYRGKSDLGIITRSGTNKVYKHITSIAEPEFINMTWEVFSDSPSYVTNGVNIVSPTSYQISDKKSTDSVMLNSQNKTLYFNSSLTNDYLNYAKTNGYKVWIMYKTDFTTDTAREFLKDAKARNHANSILISEILKYNHAGINFDFENMYKDDKGLYTNHVKEISIMAHTLGVSVSVDVTKYEPTSYSWAMCYDRDSLSNYADYIILMAYDQYYASSKIPGPVSGLEWTEDCINLTLKEVKENKLILGIPYYIRIWETKNSKVLSSKAVSMDEALRQIYANNAIKESDLKHGLDKYSWEDNGKVYMLWLENAESVVQRVKLAKKYSLAGIASWRRGFETTDVWDEIYNEIKN